VKWGLRIAWLAFFVGLVAALWAAISFGLAGAHVSWSLRAVAGALLLSGLLLLTPTHIVSWTLLVVLILISRGIGWLRWFFAALAVYRGVGFVRLYSQPGWNVDLPIEYVSLSCVVAHVVAAALLLSPAANAWFRMRASPVVQDDPSSGRDVL
jgi:hypothetical protein